jgi:hypothetical protein
MRGVITNKDVLANLGVIVSEFGMMTLVRCVVAAMRGTKTTFLDLALKHAER